MGAAGWTDSAAYSAAAGDSALAVEIGDRKAEGKVAATGGWDKFATVEMGTIEVKKAGDQQVKVRPRDPAAWKPVNLRWVRLTKDK